MASPRDRRAWARSLRLHLERRKLTVAELARAIGVSPSTAHYWLRGSIPRGPTRERVEAWIAA